MATSDLLVRIAADISGFDRATNAAVSKLKNLAGQFQSIGSSLSIGITVPIAGFAGVALKAAGDLDALRRALDTVTGSAKETARQMADMREVAKLPGLGFAEAVQGSVRLQAVGFSAAGASKVLREFGNAIASAGGGREQLQGVIVQLGQMANSSKVLSQDLRPIIQQVPQVAAVLRKEFGTIDTEVLQKMGISSQQMIQTIIDGLGKLPRVTGGIKNDFENLKDTIDQSLAEAGSALAPFATKVLNDMVLPSLGALKTLADGFKALSPATQTAIVAIGGVAVATGPAVYAIGAITNTVLTLTSAATKLAGTAFFTGALAVGPYVALAAALGFIVEKVYSLNSVSERMNAIHEKQSDQLTKLDAQWKLQKYGIIEQTSARAESIGGILEFVAAQDGATKANDKNANSLGLSTVTAKAAAKATREESEALGDFAKAFKGMSADITKNNALSDLAKNALEASISFKVLTAVTDLQKQATDAMVQAMARVKLGIVANEVIALAAELPKLAQGLEISAKDFDAMSVATDMAAESQRQLNQAADDFKAANPAIFTKRPQMNPNLDDNGKEIEKQTKEVQKLETLQEKASRQVSLIINDISRNIADNITNWKGMSAAAVSTFKNIGNAILRAAIETQLKKISKVILDLVGNSKTLGTVFGKVFGTGASTAATAAPSVIKNAASGGTGAIGGIGGAAGSAAGSGATAIVGAVAGVVSAVSSVIGNFQMHGMNKSLDLIVNHTLRTANQLIEGIQPQINTYLPYLQMIHDRLATIVDRGGGISGGGSSNVTINVSGAGNSAEVAKLVVRQMKLAGAIS